MITNLLMNAVKFGAHHPIHIAVSAKGEWAEILVQDYGIGIPKAEQERIFRVFERAVSFKAFAGLGLGLYITKEIVFAHGGTIELQSEPGKGACFKITLPLALSWTD